MVDNLCEAKEIALNAINPYIFTIATLTGHVIRLAFNCRFFLLIPENPNFSTSDIGHFDFFSGMYARGTIAIVYLIYNVSFSQKCTI